MLDLNTVTLFISSLKPCDSKGYDLFIVDDSLRALRRFICPPVSGSTFHVSQVMINEGLTSNEWERIKKWLIEVQQHAK